MKVVCVGYREWALKIYENLQRETSHDIHILQLAAESDLEQLRESTQTSSCSMAGVG